jgi:hypothetical protein
MALSGVYGVIMKTVTIALFFILFATACSKIRNSTDSNTKEFSISSSDVVSAAVVFAAGRNASNPTQVETLVEINLSPDGAANFAKFVQSHTNELVTILVGNHKSNVIFRGAVTNGLQEFDIHCASSNEAQTVADILNKR